MANIPAMIDVTGSLMSRTLVCQLSSVSIWISWQTGDLGKYDLVHYKTWVTILYFYVIRCRGDRLAIETENERAFLCGRHRKNQGFKTSKSE